MYENVELSEQITTATVNCFGYHCGQTHMSPKYDTIAIEMFLAKATFNYV